MSRYRYPYRYAEDAEEYADYLFHLYREMTEEEKLSRLDPPFPHPEDGTD